MPSLLAARKRLEKARERLDQRKAVAEGHAGPIILDLPFSAHCPTPRLSAAMDGLEAKFPHLTFIHLSIGGLYEVWEPRKPAVAATAPGMPWSAALLECEKALEADEAEWMATEDFRSYLSKRAAEVIDEARASRSAHAVETLKSTLLACVRCGVPVPLGAADQDFDSEAKKLQAMREVIDSEASRNARQFERDQGYPAPALAAPPAPPLLPAHDPEPPATATPQSTAEVAICGTCGCPANAHDAVRGPCYECGGDAADHWAAPADRTIYIGGSRRAAPCTAFTAFGQFFGGGCLHCQSCPQFTFGGFKQFPVHETKKGDRIDEQLKRR